MNSKAVFYYWRDKTGHEIDLLIERCFQVLPLEIKSAMTYHTDFSSSPKMVVKTSRK